MKQQALKDRLLNISKEQGIRFNQCWKNLILERFLARLSHSSERDKFIFKGGFLLSYVIDIGRETTDLDFLLKRMNGSEQEIIGSLNKIISQDFKDGFIFVLDQINALDHPHMLYPGCRVTLKVSFEQMKDKIQIDIGLGDAVIPNFITLSAIQYKGNPLFEDEITVMAYPTETIFSEKLETLISKGSQNSRMKDYHDLFLLCREQDLIDKESLILAIEATFLRRESKFTRIELSPEELRDLQKLWTAHCKGLGVIAQDLELPGDIKLVIDQINRFLDNCMISINIDQIIKEHSDVLERLAKK